MWLPTCCSVQAPSCTAHSCPCSLHILNVSPAGAEQAPSEPSGDLNKPVVICGFGELGQVVANIMSAPPQPRSDFPPVPYVAFDIHADRVNQARAHGFNCLYGDASRAQVRHSLQGLLRSWCCCQGAWDFWDLHFSFVTERHTHMGPCVPGNQNAVGVGI